MNNQIKEQKLTILRELVKDVDFPIIVEGKKDKKVLTKLGFQNIFTISGKSTEAIVELVNSSKPVLVSILTDFDVEGRRHFSKLVKFFQSYDIKVDNFLRRKIKYIASIQKIEELAFFLKDDHSSLLSYKTV